MGHLNGILARVGGNLNNDFQRSQMPGEGMLKLQFDRYISLTRKLRKFFICLSFLKVINRDLKIPWTRPRRTSTGREMFNSWN